MCWETFDPEEADPSTATSGQCLGNCYASAYKYKGKKRKFNTYTNMLFSEIGKSETTYHWYVKRGCDTSKKILTGTSAASGLFGIKQTDYACTFQNGTLCNAQIGNYDTSLQIKFQTVGMLRCLQCTTSEDNTDKDRDRSITEFDPS